MLSVYLQAFNSQLVRFQLHVENSVLLLKTLDPLLKLFPGHWTGGLEAVRTFLLAVDDRMTAIKTATVAFAGAIGHD